MDFTVKEINSKQILTKSKLPGVDYSINPYVGCEHACKYCYAVFMKKFTSQKGNWGEFVDVKINANKVLRYELKTNKPGTVLMSSVTDPYQPAEGKYEITRKTLEEFLKSGKKFDISILTKSTLALRDIDLLKKLDCSVGFSISTLDEVQKIFEPNSSSTSQRFKALKELKKNNIKTYAFLGPILPKLTENDIEDIFKELSTLDVNHVWVDKLNTKGNWEFIEQALKQHYPELLDEWKKILFGRTGYWRDVKADVTNLSKKYNIKTIFCF